MHSDRLTSTIRHHYQPSDTAAVACGERVYVGVIAAFAALLQCDIDIDNDHETSIIIVRRSSTEITMDDYPRHQRSAVSVLLIHGDVGVVSFTPHLSSLPLHPLCHIVSCHHFRYC